jgi:beta-N-acetylhexosaminidase
MAKYRFYPILLFWLALIVQILPAKPKTPDFWSEADLNSFPETVRSGWAMELAKPYVSLMSREELLSQVLMIGYQGTNPPQSVLEWVKKWGIGGIKIFGWNAADTTVLAGAIASLQRETIKSPFGIPAIFATDEEGGWIRHVHGAMSESPGNMAIGATRSESDAFLTGYYYGKELSILGITMNFAPVVDIATVPESGIIGPRSFSSDPELVARLGSAYARGLKKAGVIATGKHFPGHGATAKDSHGILPVIEADAATFWNRELVPFRRLARDDIPAIMTGHLAFPKITGDMTPASLSSIMIQDYLREKLGFKGLVVTDDLYMVGAEGDGGIVEACRKAVMAGNDLLLLSRSPDENGGLWRGLNALYDRDPAFRSKVREAATKVIALKLEWLRPKGRGGLVPDPRIVAASLPLRAAENFFSGLADRSATLVSGANNLPFAKFTKGSNTTAMPKILLAGPFDTFISIGGKYYPDSTGFMFSYSPDQKELDSELAKFRSAIAGIKNVIVCVADSEGMQFAYEAHSAGCKVAIVSVLSPIAVKYANWADAIVAVYHYADICLDAGFKVLAGRIQARGKLPIEVPLSGAK